MADSERPAALTILIVVGFLALLPIVLLLAGAYYVIALAHGLWALAGWARGRRPESASLPLPAPHLWDLREPTRPRERP